MRHHRVWIGTGLILLVAGVLAIPPASTATSLGRAEDNPGTTPAHVQARHSAPIHPAAAQPGTSSRRLSSLVRHIHVAATTMVPTWTLQPSGTTQGLRGVTCAPDGSFCYATGLMGTIVVTTSATTSSWQPQPSGASTELAGVSCPSTTRCYAVGATGTIVVTSSVSATSWQPQTSNAGSAFLLGLACPGVLTCYAVGTDNLFGPTTSTIVRTTNGGLTWAPTITTTPAALFSVACLSLTLCYAVGTNSTTSPTAGTILLTTDGGATWTTQQTFAAPGALSGVTCLAGTTTCYATGTDSFLGGARSYIVGTTAAGPGATWSILQTFNNPPGTTQPPALLGITCTSVSTCYAVGADSFIAPTTSFIVTTNDGWASSVVQSFSPMPSILYGVTCRDPFTCYAVGGPNGAILVGTLAQPPASTPTALATSSATSLPTSSAAPSPSATPTTPETATPTTPETATPTTPETATPSGMPTGTPPATTTPPVMVVPTPTTPLPPILAAPTPTNITVLSVAPPIGATMTSVPIGTVAPPASLGTTPTTPPLSLLPMGTATLMPTQTPIPGQAASRGATPSTPPTTTVSTATAVVTGCATQPFSFMQPGTVPTGTVSITGSTLSLAAGATLIAPNGQYALVAPATLSAPLTVTFSSATEFMLAGPGGGLRRLTPPVQVLLPTGSLLSVREPATGQFRTIYDKRGTVALSAGSYRVGETAPVHFSPEVALDVLALGNEPLTVCSGNPVRLYASTFPAAQVTISAFGQDQSGTADSMGQVQFTLTAPSVVTTTTEIYTAQVTHTRADGGVTTLTAKQRFRVIPTLP